MAPVALGDAVLTGAAGCPAPALPSARGAGFPALAPALLVAAVGGSPPAAPTALGALRPAHAINDKDQAQLQKRRACIARGA
jgi:hypothetical protein